MDPRRLYRLSIDLRPWRADTSPEPLVAAVAAPFDRDVERALARVETYVARAREQGAGLLVLPESALGGYLREHGLYTMIANNSIHTNPPLCITEEQLGEGFEIIDRALDIADQAVTG